MDCRIGWLKIVGVVRLGFRMVVSHLSFSNSRILDNIKINLMLTHEYTQEKTELTYIV